MTGGQINKKWTIKPLKSAQFYGLGWNAQTDQEKAAFIANEIYGQVVRHYTLESMRLPPEEGHLASYDIKIPCNTQKLPKELRVIKPSDALVYFFYDFESPREGERRAFWGRAFLAHIPSERIDTTEESFLRCSPRNYPVDYQGVIFTFLPTCYEHFKRAIRKGYTPTYIHIENALAMGSMKNLQKVLDMFAENAGYGRKRLLTETLLRPREGITIDEIVGSIDDADAVREPSGVDIETTNKQVDEMRDKVNVEIPVPKDKELAAA